MGNLLDLFVFKYNRTDFHELNLDWLISDLKTLAETLEKFISLNAIKYADPIQWNITTQYEANTIVIDPATGTAFLSTNPVPSGIAITNTDYWTPVFSLQNFFRAIGKNFTIHYEEAGTTNATYHLQPNDWVVINDVLYSAIQEITIGTAYVIGTNISRLTIEQVRNSLLSIILNTRVNFGKDFTNHYETAGTTNATYHLNPNEWVVIGDELYSATQEINVGDTYEAGTNIAPVTVEQVRNSLLVSISNLNDSITAETNLRIYDNINRFNLRKKNILILGDSYTDGVDDQYGTQRTEFGQYIQNYNIFGRCDVVAQGGMGFTGKEGAGSGTTGPSLEWKTLLTNWVADKTAAYLAEINEVYIIGGFNDHYSTESVILNHIEDFMSYAKSVLPSARFYVGMCAWCGTGSITTPNETANGSAIRLAISTVVYNAYLKGAKFGYTFLGHFNRSLHKYNASFDGTKYHPSNTAQEELSIEILNGMLGGIKTNNSAQTTVAFVTGSDNKSYSAYTYRIMDDEMQILYNPAYRFMVNTPTAITHGQYGLVNVTPSTNFSIAPRGGSQMLSIPCDFTVPGSGVYTNGIIFIDSNDNFRLWSPIDISANANLSVCIHSCTIGLLDS